MDQTNSCQICHETLAIDEVRCICGRAMHVRCIAGQSCAVCRCRYVFSDAEVINSVIDANAGIDACGAALDSPQNVLAEFEDVPVLPLCCPRLITVDVFDPEDRRMRPSHDGSWLCFRCHRDWQVSHQLLQRVLPHRCSCREHGPSAMVIDLFTGHSEWHCVVGNTRETLMPVPCNGLHFPSSMEIEDQVISSSSDEIVPDTSAPIVEQKLS